MLRILCADGFRDVRVGGNQRGFVWPLPDGLYLGRSVRACHPMGSEKGRCSMLTVLWWFIGIYVLIVGGSFVWQGAFMAVYIPLRAGWRRFERARPEVAASLTARLEVIVEQVNKNAGMWRLCEFRGDAGKARLKLAVMGKLKPIED
jgi:hypothetical protein